MASLSPVLFLTGTSHFVKQQWTEALIFLWTASEQAVNIIWEAEIVKQQGEKTIAGRKKFLEDYRTWTTSTKIELLYQRGFINIELYEMLNVARKARNEFIHNGKQIKMTDAKAVLEALFHLMSLLVSDYAKPLELQPILTMILKNERGDLFPKKTVFEKDEVTHWLELPALPGDIKWGDAPYELIDEIRLLPLKQ